MPSESTKPKSAPRKSARRREELRRSIPKPGVDFKSVFFRRDLITTLIIFVAFYLFVGAMTDLSRDRVRLGVGQVMTDTRVKRVDFKVVDEEMTEMRRQNARERAPRVYVLNDGYLNRLKAALMGLPEAVGGKSALSEVTGEIQTRFELNDERLAALQQFSTVDEANDRREATSAWRSWVTSLIERLPTVPTIASEQYQVEKTRPNVPEFRAPSGPLRTRDYYEVRSDASSEGRGRWTEVVRQAGFPSQVAPVIVSALSSNAEPIYQLDPEATAKAANDAANSVENVLVAHQAGEPIFRPGDLLTAEQLALVFEENRQWDKQAPWSAKFAESLGAWGVIALIVGLLGGYLIRFYPRITRNPLRVTALVAVMGSMLATTVFVSASAPAFTWFSGVATTLIVAIMLVIAYDQRIATMLAVLQCVMTTFAIEQSIGFFVLLIATCGTAVAWLREVRHRNTLIRATSLAALVAGVGTLLVGMLETPIVDASMGGLSVAWKQIWSNGGLSVLAAMGVGFLLLGVLPSIERIFDMTTGMTLVELRDPRQPLLRQLQERAPGSYNHSLQVASVAEAAAEAIGADSLLTYVGALYHDIGKMNKPGYFVENQSGGANKHAKLSPAMSLLVIVGHVKDGVELAKEYNLPRPVLHFIESHHGTTLVEYFYYAAKEKAEAEGDSDKVSEVEFRYPGPRPRTKEAAILMLADASESATRAMDQVTLKGIENLVRKLSKRRLEDGQFDDCDLTLRELRAIEDAIVRTLWSIYHGRIAYPDDEQEHDKRPASELMRARAS